MFFKNHRKGSRVLSALIAFVMLFTLMNVSVFAEETSIVTQQSETAPVLLDEYDSESEDDTESDSKQEVFGNITATFSGNVDNMKVKLSWPEVIGATKYTGTITSAGTLVTTFETESNAVTVKNVNIANGKKYDCTITPDAGGSIISASFGTNYIYTAASSVTAKLSKIHKLKVTWVKGSGIDSYALYTNENESAYGSADSDEESCTGLLPSGEARTIRVRGYLTQNNKVYVDSSDSNSVKVSKSNAKKYIFAPTEYYWYAKIKKATSVYESKSLKGKKVGTLKKGAKVKAVGKDPAVVEAWKYPTKVQVKLSDGQKGWISYSKVSSVKLKVNVKKKYTPELAEYYVRNYKSDTNQLVWLSIHTQRAYVFKKSGGKWSLVKSARITSGKFQYPTKLGSYEIKKHQYRRDKLTDDDVPYHYFYCSFFTSGLSMHSGCYFSETGKAKNTVIKSGQPNTMGCIRMYMADAKWIYNNVKTGSAVEITKC